MYVNACVLVWSTVCQSYCILCMQRLSAVLGAYRISQMARDEAEEAEFVTQMVISDNRDAVGGRNMRLCDLLSPTELRRYKQRKARERRNAPTHSDDPTIQQRLQRGDRQHFAGESSLIDVDELEQMIEDVGDGAGHQEAEVDEGGAAGGGGGPPPGLQQHQLDAMVTSAVPLPVPAEPKPATCLLCEEDLYTRPVVHFALCPHRCCAECAMIIFESRTTCLWCFKNVLLDQ